MRTLPRRRLGRIAPFVPAPLVWAPLVWALLAGLGAVACGSDEGTRGLQPSHETATPNSDAEDAMTEAERQKQQAVEMQQAHAQELEQAEDR